MRGNLLTKRRSSADGADTEDALLDYRHQVEKDLTAKVEATLEPLLGDGHFRVGVTADCDISTTEQTDETYDPTRSVMSTSQKTEDISNNSQPGGVPGTPSNLPRSTIKPLGAVGGSSGTSRRTESMAFETSRTVRQVKMPRGNIRRISAAVLLDQDSVWQGQGAKRKRVLAPPTPERIKAIHDIVAGVLGTQTDRGDQVVIESLPFEQTLAEQEADNAAAVASTKPGKTLPQMPYAKLLADRRVQIGAGVGGVLLIVALIFLLKRRKKPEADLAEGAPTLPPGAEGNKPSRDGAERFADDGHQIAAADDEGAPVVAHKPRLALPEMDSETKILLQQIQGHVAKDPAFAAGVIRGWMEEE
jgi:flagellar M-ring protein FliF